MEFDSLHYNTRKIDSYNKHFNFIVSEREAGKTTYIWCKKVFKAFKERGQPTLVIRRLINDITDVYIDDILNVLKKFSLVAESVEFEYKKGSIKEGIVDIKLGGKLFLRMIALSNPMSRIKSLILRNIAYIVFDEFICNMKLGEKYLNNEGFKFKELYNTFQRETNGLKCYFLGNPYSVYNPYFVEFGIDTKKLLDPNSNTLARGNIFEFGEAVVELYEITKELREFILERNPLYSFDDSYTKYAREGININDMNVPVGECPEGYQVKFIFKVGEKYLAIRQSTSFEEDFLYYVEYTSSYGKRKQVYCFDFQDIVTRSILISSVEKLKFSSFKNALRRHEVLFNTIDLYYLIDEIFAQI